MLTIMNPASRHRRIALLIGGIGVSPRWRNMPPVRPLRLDPSPFFGPLATRLAPVTSVVSQYGPPGSGECWPRGNLRASAAAPSEHRDIS